MEYRIEHILESIGHKLKSMFSYPIYAVETVSDTDVPCFILRVKDTSHRERHFGKYYFDRTSVQIIFIRNFHEPNESVQFYEMAEDMDREFVYLDYVEGEKSSKMHIRSRHKVFAEYSFSYTLEFNNRVSFNTGVEKTPFTVLEKVNVGIKE